MWLHGRRKGREPGTRREREGLDLVITRARAVRGLRDGRNARRSKNRRKNWGTEKKGENEKRVWKIEWDITINKYIIRRKFFESKGTTIIDIELRNFIEENFCKIKNDSINEWTFNHIRNYVLIKQFELLEFLKDICRYIGLTTK